MIKKRISFPVYFLLFIILGGLSYFSLQSLSIINSTFKIISESYIPVLSKLSDMSIDISNTKTEFYRYTNNYEPSPYKVKSYLDLALKKLTEIREEEVPQQIKELYFALETSITDYLRLLEMLEKASIDNDHSFYISLSATLISKGNHIQNISEIIRNTLGNFILIENLETRKQLVAYSFFISLSSIAILILIVSAIIIQNRYLFKTVREKTGELEDQIKVLTEKDNALKVSEEKFRELTEMLPVTIFETDSNYNFTFLNHQFFKDFKYTLTDINESFTCFDLFEEESGRLFREAAEKKHYGSSTGMLEYNALRSSGSLFPVFIQYQAIVKNSVFSGLRGFILDIEKPKKMEEQISQYQKTEVIGQLAGGIAHDFNNMLAPVLGYTEMLMDDFADDKNTMHSLNQIYKAGVSARMITQQLLAFARKQPLEIKPLNLNKSITDLMEILKRTIHENVKIDLNLSDNLSAILADKRQIEQIILNLTVNAQDAMINGGIITIKTGKTEVAESDLPDETGAAAGKYITITFSDTGAGMDKKTIESIFDPFFTTKKIGHGTGLGLSTVYGIVKQHNAYIKVHSYPGKGTDFVIYFPEGGSLPVEEKDRTLQKNTDSSGETILVVEDNKQVINLVTGILNKYSYNVFSSESPLEAVSFLKKHDGEIDLLLTDVIMPELNGRELYEIMKIIRPGLKVLYMSGYTDRILSTQGILNSRLNFIRKPFQINELLEKVREVLKQK